VSRYAEHTSVSADRSRSEIESTLRRYGADQFMYGWDQTSAVVMFQADGRRVKFVLPLPDARSREFTHTPTRNTPRTTAQAEQAWEQACRQRWRALALVIKAKLEAVEAGITTFEDEFLANIMLPNGSTVGEWTRPQLTAAYEAGAMPALLPGSDLR
jgi:hypothetical protein